MLSVIATDIAQVTVTLPTHGGGALPAVYHPVTNVSYMGGNSFQVTLQQYESMQVTNN